MTEVRPFHGLRFDPKVIGDIGQIICPPYDVIDPGMQLALHGRSEYNIVRLEYGLSQSDDSPPNNKYTRGGATLDRWLEEEAVKRDSYASFYLHHHQFLYQGNPCVRRGLLAAVRLEEWDKGVVRRHEGTAAVFKTDRLNLLRAMRTNISPVMAMYQDRQGIIAGIIDEAAAGEPLCRASMDGESHILWAMKEVKRLDTIRRILHEQNIYIADGHHRYETGLNYRNERRAAFPTAGHDSAFNFILMSLIELSDPCVIVLPTHRMVKGLEEPAFSRVMEKAGRFFDIESLSPDIPTGEMAGRMLAAKGQGRIVLGMLGPRREAPSFLHLRDYESVSGLMPADRSEAYRKLDVSVLHHVILEHMLGLEEGRNIAYTRSESEARERVAAGEYELAFLLNPVDAAAIKAVADAGDKMPQKSTYFYPKEPAGLVLNSLDGDV